MSDELNDAETTSAELYKDSWRPEDKAMESAEAEFRSGRHRECESGSMDAPEAPSHPEIRRIFRRD